MTSSPSEPDARTVVGWDIGGVNTKAVRLDRGPRVVQTRAATRYFEIWHDRERLVEVLRDVAGELELVGNEPMAVTMTAELSDAFRTRREGVLFVFDNVRAAFPRQALYALDLAGSLVPVDQAYQRPLDFAAANWLAAALFVARHYPDCLLVDVGSTTTDIVPIQAGQVVTRGRTDLERLAAGELVYTGILRTNPNTVVSQVPIRGQMRRVAAEYFCIMADVYLLLGRITPDDYTCTTPDGRGKTPGFARQRLARLVCADDEMLSEREIARLARYLYEKQLQQITEALFQVLSRLDVDDRLPLVTAGIGQFLAVEAGQRLTPSLTLPRERDRELAGGQAFNSGPAAVMPCLAVAHLLVNQLEASSR
jgi:probable H4MPT-linked C1 transfer pathway protein